MPGTEAPSADAIDNVRNYFASRVSKRELSMWTPVKLRRNALRPTLYCGPALVALFTACSSPAGIASNDSGGAAGTNPGSAGTSQNNTSGAGGSEDSGGAVGGATGGTASDPSGGAAGSAETTGGEHPGG